MCLALFFLVSGVHAQSCATTYPDANKAPVITVGSSLTKDAAGIYRYKDKTPFPVTIDFRYPINTIALESPSGFTRSPAGTTLSNQPRVLNLTYTPTGTENLMIQIQAGKAYYTSPFEPTPCSNVVASDIIQIRYTWANAWWTTTTATCDPWETSVTIKGVSTCVCDPSYQVNGKYQCCGIKLLTSVPFIGKCITMLSDDELMALWAKATANPDALTVSEDTAFPRLMLWLTKILVTVILLASFIAIIVAGVMMAASGSGEEWYSNGKKLIGSIIAALALLGASGVILRLINPNFFG